MLGFISSIFCKYEINNNKYSFVIKIMKKVQELPTSTYNAANTTTGVVPFMELYSQTTNTIGQEGRRGALMLSLDIAHPDSPEFAICKRDLTKITGANISLKVRKDFIDAVEKDEDYILRFPVDSVILEGFEPEEYNILLKVPNEQIYLKKVKARELWETIMESNWQSAEPGILFWDEIIDNDPAGVYDKFRAISTNPCGRHLPHVKQSENCWKSGIIFTLKRDLKRCMEMFEKMKMLDNQQLSSFKMEEVHRLCTDQKLYYNENI